MSEQLDIERLKRLCEQATPGPWYDHNPDDDMCMNVYAVSTSPIEPDVGLDHRSNDHASIVALTLFQSPRIVDHEAAQWDVDAEFIAAARTALPALLDRLEQAKQQLEQVRILLRDLYDWMHASGLNKAWQKDDLEDRIEQMLGIKPGAT